MKTKLLYLRRKENIVTVLCLLLIIYIYTIYLFKLNRIQIVGDEFGYWADASFLAGFDWTSVASHNAYYSFGYSIFLAPLFIFSNHPEIMYRLAIILNVLFMCGGFLLLYSSGKVLFQNVNKYFLICTALAITFYSNNIYQSQTTQTECILWFFSCLSLWALIKLYNSGKVVWSILYAFSLVYLYCIHMRCLGILIAGIITVVLMVYTKKISAKNVIVILTITIGCYLLSFILKDIFMNGLNMSGKTAEINDYAGQVGKVRNLTSIKGIIQLFISFFAKVFYLGSSTFFLFYLGMFFLIKKFLDIIKMFINKVWEPHSEIWIFLLLSMLATLGISSISMMENGRIDMLIYGRYNEFFLGGILICGVVELFFNSKRLKVLCILILFHVILGVGVFYQLNLTGATGLYPNNIVGIISMNMFNGKNITDYFVIIVAIETSIIASILFILFSIKRKVSSQSIIIIIVAVIWGGIGFDGCSRFIYPYQEKTDNTRIAQMIKQTDPDADIYYVVDSSNVKDNFSTLYIDYMQFLLPQYPIKYIYSSDISVVKGDAFILTPFTEEKIKEVEDIGVKIEESENFNLYVTKELMEKAEYGGQ